MRLALTRPVSVEWGCRVQTIWFSTLHAARLEEMEYNGISTHQRVVMLNLVRTDEHVRLLGLLAGVILPGHHTPPPLGNASITPVELWQGYPP